MVTLSAAAAFVALRLFAMTMAPASQVGAVPMASGSQNAATTVVSGSPASSSSTQSSSSYWLSSIPRQGSVSFGNSTSYRVYRSVKDYGAKGKPFFYLFDSLC